MELSGRPSCWSWTSVHKEQLASIARATPTAMTGYAINVVLAALAFRQLVPTAHLLMWTLGSLAVCGYVGLRSLYRLRATQKKTSVSPPLRPARRLLLFSALLALPWSVLGGLWVGSVGDSEIVLVALVVGMAASGSVLLAPVPVAAILYATTMLVPMSIKCMFISYGNHIVLGALGISYLFFLAGLIASSARIFAERLEAVERLKHSVTALVSAREATERAAMTDGLTGVANRRALMERLDALGRDKTRSTEFGVFYIDLDRFKGVNDALGHAAGDALLQMAASRVGGIVREEDLVARLGGDEFVVVASDIHGRATATALAERLVSSLSEPFQIEGQRVQIGASIGVAIASESNAGGDLLLKHADLAMYASKSSGKNAHCIFEADMLRSAEERQGIEHGLRTALARNELELFYQPIFSLIDERVTGVECLIRWRHPLRGLLSPAHFLSIADDMGMANEIGAWVIEQACAQAANWPRDIVVGINLSPLQIASDDVAQRVENALKSANIGANRLEIEITETSLLQNDPLTLDQLRRLKEIGVSIALDDFGTGYSSLSYLVSFPLDRIKIDRLFISQLGSSRQSDLIVRSISQLARNLNCTVVAEGIETPEQLQRLRSLHVGYGQGYLLGMPLPARGATELIQSTKNNVAKTA
ncbi:EAL domain-containing protein [Hyphomicrobium sp.]|uniref:putative bifunctional diguanylate cyclase/phosphodiesterase n=1 Tax=Hyphomicrobium sp. TaxID=82 RepID=UPI0025BF1AF4|nr:EAL domain-containing protein [Hyphomicrobium sp.]